MSNFIDSLRKGIDRASFEADKIMRYNRVRAEAGRLSLQARDQMTVLGERTMALYAAGNLPVPELLDLAREIADLQARAQQKEEEANTIQTEDWVEPVPSTGGYTPPGAGASGYTPPGPQGPPASSPYQPPPAMHPATYNPAPGYTPPISSPPPAPYQSPPPPSYPPPAPPVAQPPAAHPPAVAPRLEDQGTRRVPAPTETDYCPNCGAPLRPHAAFCAQCGTRL